MARFSGRVPTGGEWSYRGMVPGDNASYLIFSKNTINKNTGEETGYITVKVVLEPGKKENKGNFWLAVRPGDGHVVTNSDKWKMEQRYPKLFASIVEFFKPRG